MFTFKLYKGTDIVRPPNCELDLDVAINMANHFLADYDKVEILANKKTVIKTFDNPTPPVSQPVSPTTP